MAHIKTIDEIKAEVRAMTGKNKIFRRAKIEDVESVISHLTSKDPELWAAQWSRVAKRYEDTGAKHEQDGRLEEARAAYMQAYTYYATGRYPVPHSPGKMLCFRKSLELYERAGRYFEPPLEMIERLLTRSATPRPEGACAVPCGAGLLDAQKMVEPEAVTTAK